MAKTQETLDLEKAIWSATHKQGVFGCYEVTIGWYGKERVDYLTYDTKGIWRCYEIKVSKADFHSKAHNTFIGHYNYYVMTRELYEEAEDEIPDYVGVYIGGSHLKRAKRRPLGVDEKILSDSMIRSLFRESKKIFDSNNPKIMADLKRKVQYAEQQARESHRRYMELMNIGTEKYGRGWHREEKHTDEKRTNK